MLKKVLLMFVLAVCVEPGLRAQTGATPGGGAGNEVEKNAQLEEARQLSASAVKLHGAGKSKEALPLAERALKLREQALGAEHQLVVESLTNLAAVHFALGKPERVKSLYRRALAIYEKGGSADSARLVGLHDALGVLERFTFNDYAAAVEHAARSLALREKMLGADHDDVVRNMYRLADLYGLRGENDQALALHRSVVKLKEKDEAQQPLDLANALQRLSCLGQRLGKGEESKDAERRALQIRAQEKERREREAAAAGKASPVDVQTVDGGMINGLTLAKPPPVYLEEAKRQRITGTVFVYVTVDETGRVTDASSCGHPLLAEPSIRAAYGARFAPMQLNGKAVRVLNGIITYRFVLQ